MWEFTIMGFDIQNYVRNYAEFYVEFSERDVRQIPFLG